jgi:hypothetical protein
MNPERRTSLSEPTDNCKQESGVQNGYIFGNNSIRHVPSRHVMIYLYEIKTIYF